MFKTKIETDAKPQKTATTTIITKQPEHNINSKNHESTTEAPTTVKAQTTLT